MSEWNKTVSAVYKAGKAKSRVYTLKQAMKDARSVYTKSKRATQTAVTGVTDIVKISKPYKGTRRNRRNRSNKKR